MANTKISALPAATTPLAGTEVLPIVQGGITDQVAVNDLTVRNVRANATTGILQVTGPAAASTRVMTVPNANFTAARTDAAQSFTGDQTLSTGNLIIGTSGKGLTDSTGALTSTYNSTGITTNGTNTAGLVYRTGTYTAGATTPSVLGVSLMIITNSSPTSITNFTNAVTGQILTLYFNDSNTTVTRNNAYLSGGANFTSTVYDTLTLIYIGPYWYEVSRSINS
jgi:hypothetical protein